MGFFMPLIRLGLLGRDVLHDTLKPIRESPEQIAGLAQQVERLPCKQDVGGSIPSISTRPSQGIFGPKSRHCSTLVIFASLSAGFSISGSREFSSTCVVVNPAREA